MKILMLGWELPPYNSGGLGVACYHLSKALALQGASIDFVVPYEATHPEVSFMKVYGATPLSPHEGSGLGAYDHGFVSTEEIDLRDMRSVQQRYGKFVEELLEISHPDAIHAHDWLTMEAGMLAKKCTGAPLIVHVHATEFDRAGGTYGNPLIHEIEEQGLLMADRIIAVSSVTKALIVQRYNIPAEKIEVVHNAFEAADFIGHEYDKRTYRYLESLKDEGYTVVATVTRFTLQKGLVHFLKAAARALERYDKLVFLLAGDGDQRDELLRLSADLGIADRVIFTGFVRGRQWRDTYHVADVFVMSSVSEPFGLTALEAAHHNNALIITKQSGVGEVLSSIFRYDFWDEEKLADQMVGLALSDALMKEMRGNVKYEYASLSWSQVAQDCLALYRSIPTGAAA